MCPHQDRIYIYILKLLNITVGVFNAMVSILSAYLMVLLTLSLTYFLNYKLSVLHVVCLAILLMILAKLCFDILFIYNVVKEGFVTVRMYCNLTLILLILLTIFVVISGFLDILILGFLYGLYVSTVFLSYIYYEKIKIPVEHHFHKILGVP